MPSTSGGFKTAVGTTIHVSSNMSKKNDALFERDVNDNSLNQSKANTSAVTCSINSDDPDDITPINELIHAKFITSTQNVQAEKISPKIIPVRTQ